MPGWLEAIVIRGTAREANDRFPSMAELLRALARDPATIWRRLIAGGVLAATVAAFVIGNLRAAGHVKGIRRQDSRSIHCGSQIDASAQSLQALIAPAIAAGPNVAVYGAPLVSVFDVASGGR